MRWLRPEFQHPGAETAPTQAELATDAGDDGPVAVAIAPSKPLPWPSDAVAQVRAVADLLASSQLPMTFDDIAARFTARGPWKKRLPQLLEMLVALGRAHAIGARFAGSR